MNEKREELIGPTLDRAVAKYAYFDRNAYTQVGRVFVPFSPLDSAGFLFAPSTNWAQGGPIIEKERLELTPYVTHSKWGAAKDGAFYSDGPTPLIAAMRCYVASKMGDEVEIPEQLK